MSPMRVFVVLAVVAIALLVLVAVLQVMLLAEVR